MVSKTEYKIIFLGTPHFAVPALRALVAEGLKPQLVVTQPDRPSGRSQALTPPPVKVAAEDLGITVAQPFSKDELRVIFQKNPCDVAILVAFGMIIPSDVLGMPKRGFLNVHPSLLPKYRGASPVQTALLHGEKNTGVSIITLTNKLDSGPIIAQQQLAIKAGETYEPLKQRLAIVGADLLVATVPSYLIGENTTTIQNDHEASYTKHIIREDGLINWKNSAETIYNQFRAYHPWPGVFTFLGTQRLKITDMTLVENLPLKTTTPGSVNQSVDGDFLVACGLGAVVCKQVQLDGRTGQSGSDFLRGRGEVLGTILGHV